MITMLLQILVLCSIVASVTQAFPLVAPPTMMMMMIRPSSPTRSTTTRLFAIQQGRMNEKNEQLKQKIQQEIETAKERRYLVEQGIQQFQQDFESAAQQKTLVEQDIDSAAQQKVLVERKLESAEQQKALVQQELEQFAQQVEMAKSQLSEADADLEKLMDQMSQIESAKPRISRGAGAFSGLNLGLIPLVSLPLVAFVASRSALEKRRAVEEEKRLEEEERQKRIAREKATQKLGLIGGLIPVAVGAFGLVLGSNFVDSDDTRKAGSTLPLQNQQIVLSDGPTDLPMPFSSDGVDPSGGDSSGATVKETKVDSGEEKKETDPTPKGEVESSVLEAEEPESISPPGEFSKQVPPKSPMEPEISGIVESSPSMSSDGATGLPQATNEASGQSIDTSDGGTLINEGRDTAGTPTVAIEDRLSSNDPVESTQSQKQDQSVPEVLNIPEEVVSAPDPKVAAEVQGSMDLEAKPPKSGTNAAVEESSLDNDGFVVESQTIPPKASEPIAQTQNVEKNRWRRRVATSVASDKFDETNQVASPDPVQSSGNDETPQPKSEKAKFNAKFPTASFPKFTFPSVDLPDASKIVPKMEVPDFQLPTKPKIDLPSFEVPAFNMPSIKLPDAKIDFSGVASKFKVDPTALNVPKIDMPDISLEKIKLSRFDFSKLREDGDLRTKLSDPLVLGVGGIVASVGALAIGQSLTELTEETVGSNQTAPLSSGNATKTELIFGKDREKPKSAAAELELTEEEDVDLNVQETIEQIGTPLGSPTIDPESCQSSNAEPIVYPGSANGGGGELGEPEVLVSQEAGEIETSMESTSIDPRSRLDSIALTAEDLGRAYGDVELEEVVGIADALSGVGSVLDSSMATQLPEDDESFLEEPNGSGSDDQNPSEETTFTDTDRSGSISEVPNPEFVSPAEVEQSPPSSRLDPKPPSILPDTTQLSNMMRVPEDGMVGSSAGSVGSTDTSITSTDVTAWESTLDTYSEQDLDTYAPDNYEQVINKPPPPTDAPDFAQLFRSDEETSQPEQGTQVDDASGRAKIEEAQPDAEDQEASMDVQSPEAVSPPEDDSLSSFGHDPNPPGDFPDSALCYTMIQVREDPPAGLSIDSSQAKSPNTPDYSALASEVIFDTLNEEECMETGKPVSPAGLPELTQFSEPNQDTQTKQESRLDGEFSGSMQIEETHNPGLQGTTNPSPEASFSAAETKERSGSKMPVNELHDPKSTDSILKDEPDVGNNMEPFQ